MLYIGNKELENWLVMAPMAGITNLPFRLIVKKMGAGLVTTEMVSAMGLALAHKRTLAYLKGHPDEGPLSVQLFGFKPEIMAAAAEVVVEAGADIVDINMGCPSRKIVKTGAGGALMRTPQKAKEIVSAVRRVCPVPLTVKLRAGWSPDQPVACEIAQLMEDCGADAVTVHPRFVTQGFSGRADWDIIAKVKERIRIPVIGNGDVFDPFCAFDMKRQTGCDGVMIGRGARGNPWIFRQILELQNGLPLRRPGLQERRAVIMQHFRLLTLSLDEARAARVMRGLLLWYTKGLPLSGRFRGTMTRIEDLDTLISALDHFFSALEHRNS
ncbi:MAG: tRNA dihydrouridine synthase DusB [Thermodesulfobacteriota bacterium]|nr:tRNA dihydrouridine synthase DusB [Thermodesulfobacteriota bacterium]